MNLLNKDTDDRPMPIPCLGYCVIKVITEGKSEGGIIIPDSAQKPRKVGVMVVTSGRYLVGNELREHEVKPGQQVLVDPTGNLAGHPELMPKDHWLISLNLITAYYDKETNARLM